MGSAVTTTGRRYAGEERPVTSKYKFQVGDRVDVRCNDEWVHGCIVIEDDGSKVPYRCSGVDGYPQGFWVQPKNVRPSIEPSITVLHGLEAVTKERDDAREQLARVCAQVETLGAELKVVKADRDHLHERLAAAQHEFNDEYNGRTNAMNECVILREQRDTACRGERSADMEVERLCTLLDKRSKDARVLDCVATLLAMREAP